MTHDDDARAWLPPSVHSDDPPGESALPDPRLEEAVLAGMREAWLAGASSASGSIRSIGIYELAHAAAVAAWHWMQVERAVGEADEG
ncbi:MAG TPA: hypothetical protein VNU26_18510 [Mycobacteriales bacterium]|nr:hypothetical protein [Mycobacteriales bacterium]